MTKSKKLAFICIFALFAAACGDDEGEFNNDRKIPVYDTGPDVDTSVDPDTGADVGPDAPDPDTGDPDTGDDADSGTPAEGASCASPTDLGSLAAGQEHTFNSSLLEPASTLDTTCDLGATGSGVRVFALEVDVTSRVEFWTTLSPSRLDLRDGDCSSPTEVITCTDGGTYTATLEAGKTYHLAVWGDFNVGDFQMRATVQEAVCSPGEPNWCDSGMLNECDRGTSIDAYTCADSCADASSCSADACEAPVAVDLSGGSAVTLSGNTGAYTGTWTADQVTNCGFVQGDNGPDTPYAEMFFEVSGLQRNDQLVVDSNSPGDYAFFVLDACSASECLVAVDDDVDTGGQRLDWRVPADGSYLVVIEALATGDRDFEFQFSK